MSGDRSAPSAPEPADDGGFEARGSAAQTKQRFGAIAMAIALGLVVLGILWFGLHTLLFDAAVKDPRSEVAKPSTLTEPPGAPGLTPQQRLADRSFDAQLRQAADRTGDSFVSRPVFSGATGPAPTPVPGQTASQPVKPIVLGSPAATPVADEARRKAMLEAIKQTIAIGTADRGLGGSIVGRDALGPATPVTVTSLPSSHPSSGENHPAGSRSGAEEGALLAAPHQAYAVTTAAADSDAPATVTFEIISGPLAGGLVHGKPAVNQKTLSVTLDRLEFQGGEYKIEAIVLDPQTLSPALPVDVDNHYGQRILLPGLAAFVGGLGKAVSTPATAVNVAGLSVVQQSPKLTSEEQLAAGFGAAGQAAASALTQEATGIKPTVKLAAREPVVIDFLRGVMTGDRTR